MTAPVTLHYAPPPPRRAFPAELGIPLVIMTVITIALELEAGAHPFAPEWAEPF